MPCHPKQQVHRTRFVQEGEQGQRGPPPPARSGQVEQARDWEMLVDVGQWLTVPSHIVTTTLRPDLMLWSNTLHVVYFVEWTEPREDVVECMLLCRDGIWGRTTWLEEESSSLPCGGWLQGFPSSSTSGCPEIWGSKDKPCATLWRLAAGVDIHLCGSGCSPSSTSGCHDFVLPYKPVANQSNL